ncbi:HD domain-containing protein [Dactylosporangium sp. NPDC049140]|uniref:HD domain-containing protein n=1 Tax=Dactylosporangium sp. NPDC049140 TaxID=3155647 RepID=UPI0033C8725F
MESLVERARGIAAVCLAEALPRRWTHVQAVGAKAERVAASFSEPDGAVLAAAAWLHDVGYAPALAATGFHPLDGARWLRSEGFDDRVAALVAHHSCALVEADERGLGDVLGAEFAREQSPVADALWYCDMTTGPDGQDLDVVERLAEITSRYGPDHIVTRFIERAGGEITAAVRRAEAHLTAAGRQPMYGADRPS